MKKSFSLNLSFKAIEAKAQHAALIAEAQHKNRKKAKPKKKIPDIEVKMLTIRKLLERKPLNGLKVVFENPGQFSSAHSIIKIFTETEINRYKTELEKKKEDYTLKVQPPIPIQIFAFYPSTIDKLRLGSIAIYGDNAVEKYQQLQSTGLLFGIKIAAIKIEEGLRPFIDVKLIS